jgi:NADH-quinone oxidoreductase subunit J
MIAFWVLAVILLASAVWCVTATKPVYSVIALLLHFAALAATYLTLNAEFLAVIQIIIYSGAILILFVFVIALLSSGVAPFSVGPNRLPRIVYPALALVVIALAFLTWVLGRVSVATPAVSPSGSTIGPAGVANVFGSVNDFGTALFTTYRLPFEMTSLILMVAVIGVVFLAGDQTPYVGTKRQAEDVQREMREAILREGGP